VFLVAVPSQARRPRPPSGAAGPKKAKTGDALLGGAAGGAKTHGNKALAKTSTKGMKSMASFFGPKK
jgi:hypothetical protein